MVVSWCSCLASSSHFFLPPAAASSFLSQVTTFPSITTPLPSKKATRERPSQFLKLSHTSGCCGWKAHEADGRIPDLDLAWDVEHLDLRVELLGLPEGRVLLVHHHVTSPRHVVLVEALDIEADVVAPC